MNNSESRSLIVRNNFHQSVAIEYSNVNPTSKQFSVNCPFVPDLIKVRGALVARSDGVASIDITPSNSTVTGVPNNWYLGSNIFQMKSDMLGNDILCMCNITNTFNPVYEYWNPPRQMFQGTYSLSVLDITSDTPISSGFAVLTFEFIRFADK